MTLSEIPTMGEAPAAGEEQGGGGGGVEEGVVETPQVADAQQDAQMSTIDTVQSPTVEETVVVEEAQHAARPPPPPERVEVVESTSPVGDLLSPAAADMDASLGFAAVDAAPGDALVQGAEAAAGNTGSLIDL